MNTKVKKVGSIVAAVAMMGGLGAINSEAILKAYDCVGREIQIETQIGDKTPYLCGNQQYYNNVKGEAKKKLRDNTMQVTRGKDGDEEVTSDYVIAVLIARNDAQFFNDTRDIMVSKYDPEKKKFDGSKFDTDFMEQMAFYIELANIKCGGKCELDMQNFDESIYNLIK